MDFQTIDSIVIQNAGKPFQYICNLFSDSDYQEMIDSLQFENDELSYQTELGKKKILYYYLINLWYYYTEYDNSWNPSELYYTLNTLFD